MVQVQQWSGCIKRKGSKFEINLKKITALVKVAMGELSGLSGLLNDLEGTLMLTCDVSSSNNHFTKVDMSQCGTRLLGVSFYSTSKECRCVGVNTYTTELNCKMISADVSQTDKEQVAKIKNYFDEKFNIIVTHKNPVVRTPCGPSPKSDPKMKEYKIVSEGVPGPHDPAAKQLSEISLHTIEDVSDEDLYQGEAGCQAPPPSPNEHRKEHL
tara:strand:+ start:27102 stop:27737 length:636 start_codon:yes stop_codon:yes gene_type:complete